MAIQIRLLRSGDEHLLGQVAEDVFDAPPVPEITKAFLADPRHHIVVALDADTVVGMASAFDYIHPDKPVELWINEVGVAVGYRRQGIAGRLLRALLAHARVLGCKQAWVGTEYDNEPARALYKAAGGKEEPFVMYAFDLNDAGGSPWPR